MVIFLFVQVGYVGSLEGRQIGVVLDTIAPTGNILGFACFGWLEKKTVSQQRVTCC